jgi:hypothetical protein
MLKQG